MSAESAASALPGDVPAPDVRLVAPDGAEVQLASLWAPRPLVVAFFGDLGNPFTADNAAQLRDGAEAIDRAGAGLVAIAAGTAERVDRFDQAWSLPYPLLADPEGSAARAFGVDGAATFVIDTAGVVRHERHAANLADYPPVHQLVAACCEVTGAEPPAPPLATVRPLEFDETGRIKSASGFTCGKCGYVECDRGEISTAGGLLSRLFNLQHNKFTAVSCRSCGYTELYRKTSGAVGNVVDFLAN